MDLRICKRTGGKDICWRDKDLEISNTELLEKLDLIEDGKLKRAGALCFYRKAEKVISGCYVKIGKFEGSDLLYQDKVRGSLLIIADRVIDLIYRKQRYPTTRKQEWRHTICTGGSEGSCV